MRYDKPVYFRATVPGEFDKASGNYGEDTITEERRYASVTDTGAQMLTMLFGKVKQGALTIRLQRPYIKAFDSIRIGDTVYSVAFSRNKRVFVINEVQ